MSRIGVAVTRIVLLLGGIVRGTPCTLEARGVGAGDVRVVEAPRLRARAGERPGAERGIERARGADLVDRVRA